MPSGMWGGHDYSKTINATGLGAPTVKALSSGPDSLSIELNPPSMVEDHDRFHQSGEKQAAI